MTNQYEARLEVSLEGWWPGQCPSDQWQDTNWLWLDQMAAVGEDRTALTVLGVQSVITLYHHEVCDTIVWNITTFLVICQPKFLFWISRQLECSDIVSMYWVRCREDDWWWWDHEAQQCHHFLSPSFFRCTTLFWELVTADKHSLSYSQSARAFSPEMRGIFVIMIS